MAQVDVQAALARAGVPMLKTAAVVPAPDSPEAAKSPKGKAPKQTELIPDKLQDLLNQQIGNEVFASYAYHAIASWFQSKGLDGFAAYCEKQGTDEVGHAKKIYKFLLDAGVQVELPPIKSPMMKYDEIGVGGAVHAILEHEKSVTASWREIGALVMKSANAAAMDLVSRFMTEQLEEESKVYALYQKVSIASEGTGILLIDAELKKQA
jgi:ferritin